MITIKLLACIWLRWQAGLWAREQESQIRGGNLHSFNGFHQLKACVLCVVCWTWSYFKSTDARASVGQQTGRWLQIQTQSGVQLGFRQPRAWPPDNFLGGGRDVCARGRRYLASWQEWARLESTNRHWPVGRENGTLTASPSTEFSVLCSSRPSQWTYIVIKIGEDLRLCWSRQTPA